MRRRNYLKDEERVLRSRAAKMVHRKLFLQGSLVESTFKCGKDNCWCAKADKGHAACYLSIRSDSKRKMVYIPKSKQKQVSEWVKNYKEIVKDISGISCYCLKKLKEDGE